MNNMNQNIANHYSKTNLFEEIVEILKLNGKDINKISRSDISTFDEFHVRGATVSRELASDVNISDYKVLDIGCGLGGASRLLADEYNCNVTGIDLCEEYIITSQKLSELISLSDKTNFIYGDATKLPFENSTFDVVWTQHTQMNIKDKKRFYSEIHRVLKNSGMFIYYDIFKTHNGDIEYPMPWADKSDISFLIKVEDMETILNNLKFKKEHTTDQTEAGIKIFEKLQSKNKNLTTSTPGLHLLMGDNYLIKNKNLHNALKNGSLKLQSGVYKML